MSRFKNNVSRRFQFVCNRVPVCNIHTHAAAVFALVWTTTNLAVTASRTRALQMREKGVEVEVKGQVRWLIVPLVF